MMIHDGGSVTRVFSYRNQCYREKTTREYNLRYYCTHQSMLSKPLWVNCSVRAVRGFVKMFYYLIFFFYYYFIVFELEITQFHGNVHVRVARVFTAVHRLPRSNDSRDVTVDNGIVGFTFRPDCRSVQNGLSFAYNQYAAVAYTRGRGGLQN